MLQNHDVKEAGLPAKRSIGLVALVFFLGVVLGSVVGELIGLILPEGNLLGGPLVELIEPRNLGLFMADFALRLAFAHVANPPERFERKMKPFCHSAGSL